VTLRVLRQLPANRSEIMLAMPNESDQGLFLGVGDEQEDLLLPSPQPILRPRAHPYCRSEGNAGLRHIVDERPPLRQPESGDPVAQMISQFCGGDVGIRIDDARGRRSRMLDSVGFETFQPGAYVIGISEACGEAVVRQRDHLIHRTRQHVGSSSRSWSG
jgi:hypothetical protein